LIDWCLTPTFAVFQLYRRVFWKYPDTKEQQQY